jgi:chitodextrinase
MAGTFKPVGVDADSIFPPRVEGRLQQVFLPKWTPSTAYTAGQLAVSPGGQIIQANTSFTSGATSVPTNWTVVSASNTTSIDANTHVGPTPPTDPSVLVWIDTTPQTDTTPPNAPTLAVPSATTTSVTLSWSGSTDAVGVTGYDVYRATVKIAGPITSSTYTDTGLTAGTSYGPYTVRARDAAGNVSDDSNGRTVTTLSAADTTAPTVPSGLSSSAVTGTSFTLSWTASTDSGSGVAGYTVYRDTVAVGNPTGTSFSVTGLTGGQTYSMRVSAQDVAGNSSAQSSALSVTTTASATAPAQVTGLTVTPSSGQVALTWTAPSNGGSAITDYSIQYRVTGTTPWTDWSHTASTATNATITGGTNGTSYDFRVAAINAIGTGTYSTTQSATPTASTTVFTDAFTRADATTAGNGWTAAAGSWAIASNQLKVNSTSTAPMLVQSTAPGSANQFAQMTLVNPSAITGARIGPAVRVASDVTSFYNFRLVDGANMGIYRLVSGGSVTLISGAQAAYVPQNGDVLRLEVVGSSLVAKVNGVALITATDTNVPGTSASLVGIRGASNSNGMLIDDFSHGTL